MGASWFSQKILSSTTVFNIENNNKKKWVENQHYWSLILTDHVTPETGLMLKIQLYHHRNKHIKYIKIESSYFKFKYCYAIQLYWIFNQMNATPVIIRYSFFISFIIVSWGQGHSGVTAQYKTSRKKNIRKAAFCSDVRLDVDLKCRVSLKWCH